MNAVLSTVIMSYYWLNFINKKYEMDLVHSILGYSYLTRSTEWPQEYTSVVERSLRVWEARVRFPAESN